MTCLLLFFRVSDSRPWNAGDEDDGEIRVLPDGFEGVGVGCGMELSNFPLACCGSAGQELFCLIGIDWFSGPITSARRSYFGYASR